MLNKAFKFLCATRVIRFLLVLGYIIALILILIFIPNIPNTNAQVGVRTTSSYVNGHSYIIFYGNPGFAAVHDAACYGRHEK